MWEHAFIRTVAYLVCMVLFWGSARIVAGAISTTILAWKRRGGRHSKPGPIYTAFFKAR